MNTCVTNCTVLHRPQSILQFKKEFIKHTLTIEHIKQSEHYLNDGEVNGETWTKSLRQSRLGNHGQSTFADDEVNVDDEVSAKDKTKPNTITKNKSIDNTNTITRDNTEANTINI